MAEVNRGLWKNVRITTATTTVVSANGVILGSVVVNDGGVSAGLVDLHDHPTAASNLRYSLKVPATASVTQAFEINGTRGVVFKDGFVVVTDEATDITIGFWDFS